MPPVTSAALSQPRVLVQTAAAIPTDNSGWSTHPFVRFVGGSEGALPTLGEATLEVPAGALIPEDGQHAESVAFWSPLGLVVRLLKESASGSVRVGSVYYDPFWYGQITDQTDAPDGGTDRYAGGLTTVGCAGILSLLDQVALSTGHAKAGSAAVDIGRLPPINDENWPRSASTVSGLPGGSAYVFDPTAAAAANWTALEFANYLLAAFAPHSLAAWQISGDTSALGYKPERRDWSGATLLQALLGLIDPQRGITARVEVTGRTVSLVIRTGTPTALTLGGFTLPANADTVTFSAQVNRLANVTIAEDRSSVYGTVIGRGERPIVGLTGAYSGGTTTHMLVKGWNAGTESSWNTNPSAYPDTFRRFVVSGSWSGQQFDGSAGLNGTLTRETSANYGSQGLTGARSTGGYGASGVPGQAVEFVSRIPDAVAKGDWSKPVILVKKGSTYIDKSKDWTLDIEESPPAVRIDDGSQGRVLKTFLDASWDILVSLGVREAQPLAVSYVSDGNRTKVVDLPEIELWRVAAGMRTGGTGAHAGGTIRDDTDRLRQSLPMLRARYLESDWTLQLTSQGELDIDATGQPAQLITTVNRGDTTLEPNVVVTRRTWRLARSGDGGDRWDTIYQANRIRPDVGAVL